MSQPKNLRDLNRYPVEQFAHTGDGAVVVDAEQRIVVWNEAATVLLGYRSEEALGKPCYEVIKTLDSDGAEACCQNFPIIIDSGNDQWVAHRSVLVESKTGEPICLRVASFCLLTSEKKLSSAVHVFWEVKNATDGATEAVDASRSHPSNSMEVSPEHFLSSQEKHVLRCLAAGMDSKMIAVELGISPKTVRNHVEHILKKLEVHSRMEAVAAAHQHHWA